MTQSGYIYIMTNKNHTTLYIGVTTDLCRRIYEHKNHLIKDSFTDKYNLEYCIYYEEFPYFDLAIKREKELKKWNRQKKEDLINKINPEWKVLVTEKGFVREKISFSQQVNDILNELNQTKMNDEKGSSLTVQMTDDTNRKGGAPPDGGNDATNAKGEIPPCNQNDATKAKGEIPPYNQNDATNAKGEIPPYNQNDATNAKGEIPPYGRNDSSPGGVMVEGVGGFASNSFYPSYKEPPVISSEARNLSAQSPDVISSEARDLSNDSKNVIPNETQYSEESH